MKNNKIIEVKDFKSGIVYKYTSPSGKFYIGKTINEKARKYEHKTTTLKFLSPFGRALKKYGFDNFKYEILFKCKGTKEDIKDVLDYMETIYIEYSNCRCNKIGYNITPGGDTGALGYKPSVEQRIAQSKRQKGRKYSPTTKEKMSTSCKTKKKVYQYKDDKLLNVFDSIADAARSMKNSSTIKTRSNRISEALSGKAISAYSYEWKRNPI